MTQDIKGTYDRCKDIFKGLCAEQIDVAPDSIRRKKVPKLEKPGPTGDLIQIEWEPEDGFLFATPEDLYAFPNIVASLPNVQLVPNIGLNFETATLGYLPKKPGTELSNYMIRQRFDLTLDEHARAEWLRRKIESITFGIKDKGKSIDRMEVEVPRNSLKLLHAIKGIKKHKKVEIEHHPALIGLTPSKIRSASITALSRASFFGIHYLPEAEAAVDYQLSIDFCRNTRPAILDENWQVAIDGYRFEGEFEAHGTYTNRELDKAEREEIIMTSLVQLKTQLDEALSARNIPTIETDMNKVEFAQSQVDENYGLERALKDHVKAEDYSRQPLRRALTAVFEGHEDQELVAMPTPQELREYGGIPIFDDRQVA